jgi:hypothetical protein
VAGGFNLGKYKRIMELYVYLWFFTGFNGGGSFSSL